MKKWLKERQQQQELEAALGVPPLVPPFSSTSTSRAAADAATAATSSEASTGGSATTTATGKKRGKFAYGVSVQKEREQMLVAMEGFRNSIAAAGVCLDPEASAALEGIMTGELLEAAGVAGGSAAWRDDPAGSAANSRAAGGIYQSITGGSTADKDSANSFSNSATISHDECAHQLVEMLHLLKKAPPMGGGLLLSEGSQGFSSSSSSSDAGGEGSNNEHRDSSDSDGEVEQGKAGVSSSTTTTRGNTRSRGKTAGHGQGLSAFPTSSATSASLLSSHLERVDQLRKRKRGAPNNGKLQSARVRTFRLLILRPFFFRRSFRN